VHLGQPPHYFSTALNKTEESSNNNSGGVLMKTQNNKNTKQPAETNQHQTKASKGNPKLEGENRPST
jgi:hypothetical protein